MTTSAEAVIAENILANEPKSDLDRLLKLCPFCGGDAKFLGSDNSIVCKRCHVFTICYTQAGHAVSVWNSRVEEEKTPRQKARTMEHVRR